MKKDSHYDLVVLVSNDVAHDRRMERACNALAANKWRVLIIGRELETSPSLDLKPYHVHRVRCKINHGPLFYLELNIRLANCLKSIVYDRLLCVDFDTLGVLKLVNQGSKRIYFDSHELFTEVPELHGKPIKRWLWSRLLKSVSPLILQAYTVSDEIAEELKSAYNLNFEVIHNVPLLSKSELQLTKQDPTILRLVYIGVLNPGRGLETVMKVVLECSYMTLNVVGDGPLRSNLQSMASNCQRITFQGMLEENEMVEHVKSADLGLNLLDVSSKSYYLSLANKFFDYAHCGIPSLCMNTPTYKRFTELYHCAYLIDDMKIQTVSKALKEIHDYPDQRILLSQGALALSKDYNWEIESEKLLGLYGLGL